MKTIYIRTTILFALLTVCFSSCEDFLSETPTKDTNQPVTTIEQLEALISSPTGSGMEGFFEHIRDGISLSDDYTLPLDLFDAPGAGFTFFDFPVLYHYIFDINSITGLADDDLWKVSASQIYNANLILEYIDKVDGSLEQKERLKAEAYFLRAYSNWVLVNKYCLPYSPENFDELGLPKRTSTSFEDDFSRISLKETYDFIEADLTEALKIDTEDVTYSWRATKATVNAFLSTFYMFTGRYEEAVQAADYALNHKGTAHLKDYNTLTQEDWGTFYVCETSLYSQTQMVQWPEFFYVRLCTAGYWQVPSDGLLGLYDQTNDLRYKLFVRDNSDFWWVSVPGLTYDIFGMSSMYPSGVTIGRNMKRDEYKIYLRCVAFKDMGFSTGTIDYYQNGSLLKSGVIPRLYI